jgi:hypothetical protein
MTASPSSRPASADPKRPGAPGACERIENAVPIDDEVWRDITASARGINPLIKAPRPKPG